MTRLRALQNLSFICLLCCLSLGASGSPVVCSGTEEAEQTSSNSFTKMKDLRRRFSNCQYVIGHVHIVRINETDFRTANKTFDFSFLDSIQEVTGCVQIIDSCYSTPIVFKSLRIIRGRNCLTGRSGNGSIIIQADPSCRLAQPPVDLRSLRFIERGNIYALDVANCYLERLVNTAELFQDTRGQALILKSRCTSLADRCHPGCPIWPDGRRHCWGPGPDQCQARSRCVSVPQRECPQQRCFVDSAGLERCCSEQCLGGCYGVQSSQCFGCALFSSNGTCVSTCTPRSLYDPAKTQHVQPANKLFAYGPVCVSRCPDSFFIQDDACVSKCREGFTAAADNRCVPTVSSRLCRPEPSSASLICSVNSPLLEGLTNESRLCTEYIGRFTISSTCFSPTPHSGWRQLTLAQVYKMFSRLRVLRGVVQVNLEDWPEVTNLTFFSKLERLDRTPGEARGAIMVHSNHVQFLGFSSLRHVINSGIQIYLMDKYMSVNATVDYCSSFRPSERAYTDGLIEYTGSPELGTVQIHKKIAEKLNDGLIWSGCPYGLAAACHSQCDWRYGCWGPGPDACVRCLGVKAGGVCAIACSAPSVAGWFDAGRIVKLGVGNVTERVCSACHPSCSACTGPTETDCTRCPPHLYRDGTQCVASCNLDYQFPDADRICRQCPQVCVKVGRGLPTCTGNATTVGPGGCQFCTLIVPIERSPTDSSKVLRCLSLADSCPIGYYLSALDPNRDQGAGPSGEFLALQKQASLSVSICRACSFKCLRCSESSSDCTECRYYTYAAAPGDAADAASSSSRSAAVQCSDTDKRDGKICRSGFFPVHANRTCQACDRHCSECAGPRPEDCQKCQPAAYALLADYSDPETSAFSCVERCPATHPHTVFHGPLKVMTCSANSFELQGDGQQARGDYKTSPALVALIAISLVGLMVLIIGVFLYYWFRQRGSSKRRKRPKSGFDQANVSDDDLEPLKPPDCSALPNRGSLLTISEKELVRGREVGSGAFGTVYKGEWISESEHRRVSVAIKILTDSGDTGMSSELLEESKIMASVDHPHCVRLVGICMTQPLQLITQFMPMGNLRDYLRARKDTNQIGSSHLLRYAAQIASGMAYLERCQIIHRDLACRNVLVASAKSVKITDFGLSKVLDNPNEAYTASGGKLPVKWLALESLVSRRFSHKSDVWAYGVTLWEIFTFGEPPYAHVKPKDIADYLEKGERLPQPSICTLDVYMIMIKCWMLNDQHRPSFDSMEIEFKKMANDPSRYVYIQGDRHANNASRSSNSDAGGSSAERHSSEEGGGSESPPTAAAASAAAAAFRQPQLSYTTLDHQGTELGGVVNADATPAAAISPSIDYLDASGGDQVFAEAETAFIEASPGASAAAAATLPARQQQPPPPPPPLPPHSRKSSASGAAGPKKFQYGDNFYTSDPCKPADPSPGPLGSPGGSSGADGYLQPIRLQRGGGSSASRGPLPPTPSQQEDQQRQPRPPLGAVGSPTFHNPEYFFNSTQRSPTASSERSAGSKGARSPPPPPPPPPPLPPPL